jgi:DNA-binding transcriptional MerR regulator
MGMELDARKHGFSLKDKRGVVDDRHALTAELEQDNAMLRGKIARLEDRMAVLERIATDAPTRLSAQIDELR